MSKTVVLNFHVPAALIETKITAVNHDITQSKLLQETLKLGKKAIAWQ
jgi:hypothetical protein